MAIITPGGSNNYLLSRLRALIKQQVSLFLYFPELLFSFRHFVEHVGDNGFLMSRDSSMHCLKEDCKLNFTLKWCQTRFLTKVYSLNSVHFFERNVNCIVYICELVGCIDMSKWKKLDSRNLGIKPSMVSQPSWTVLKILQSEGNILFYFCLHCHYMYLC